MGFSVSEVCHLGSDILPLNWSFIMPCDFLFSQLLYILISKIDYVTIEKGLRLNTDQDGVKIHESHFG